MIVKYFQFVIISLFARGIRLSCNQAQRRCRRSDISQILKISSKTLILIPTLVGVIAFALLFAFLSGHATVRVSLLDIFINDKEGIHRYYLFIFLPADVALLASRSFATTYFDCASYA